MTDREHCTCVDVQNMDVETAAARLCCGERLLLDCLRAEKIPHQRVGKKRVLCPCDLRMAMRHFGVAATASAPVAVPETSTPSVVRLQNVRPSRGRNRATG